MKKRRLVAALSMLAALVVASASTATAASDLISIPLEQIVRGNPGDEILVATADVPAEFVGRQCEMTGETFNQDSVHLNNDLLIQLGDQTRVLANFEDEEYVLHEFRQVEEMPARIEVSVRLGPDGVSSGGFLISIDCGPEVPPTTTSTTTTSTTTTTTTSTTTTVPVTTTSVPPTTSTTAAPPTTVTPTTTVTPPTTAVVASTTVPTTSTVGPTTTTTISVLGPPAQTSVPPTTTAAPPTTELAFTGVSGLGYATLGLAILATGLALVVGARRRSLHA